MRGVELVLSVVDVAGEVPGKTVLQKLCYFSSEKLGTDLEFRPHYYGPYSPKVSNTTDDALAVDFLSEEIERGSLASPWETPSGKKMTEWERHNYELTDDGEMYITALREEQDSELRQLETLVEELRRVTDFDASTISNMAKVHYIQKETDAASPADIQGEATEWNWDLSLPEITTAIGNLEDLQA